MIRYTVGRKIMGVKIIFVIFSALLIFSVAVAAEEYTLTIKIRNEKSEPEGGSVKLSNGDQVTINPPEGSQKYAKGTWVELVAEGNQDYEFKEWGGHLTGDDNPKTIEMNGDKTVFAYFRLNDIDKDGISDRLELEGYKICGEAPIPCADARCSDAPCCQTDPDCYSSDGDPYSDLDETKGITLPSGMPKIYMHPLVAARPIMGIEVSDFQIQSVCIITDSYGEEHTTGSSWDKSTTSSWSIGGSLGFSGKSLTGEFTGSYSQSTTHTVGGSVSDSKQWSKATAVDPSHAANLGFSYKLINKGGASISQLQYDLMLYIGSTKFYEIFDTVYDFPIEPGAKSSSVAIGVAGDEAIPLTLDQMQAILMGMPLRVELLIDGGNVMKWIYDSKENQWRWIDSMLWNPYEQEIIAKCITLYALYDNGFTGNSGKQYELYVGPGMESSGGRPDDAFYKHRTLRDTLELVLLVLNIQETYQIDGYNYTGQTNPGEVIFVIPEAQGNAGQEYFKEMADLAGDSLLDMKLYEDSDNNCKKAGIYMLACKEPFVEIADHFFCDDNYKDGEDPGKMLNIDFRTSTYLTSVEATVSYVNEDEPGQFSEVVIEPKDMETITDEGKKSVFDKTYQLVVENYDPRWKHPRLLAVEAEDVYGNKFSTSFPPSSTYRIPMPQPRTIYVSNDGGDDTTGKGTEDAPYATIQKGIDMAVDWDTVVVMSGPDPYTGLKNKNLDFRIEFKNPPPGFTPPEITKAITVRSENGSAGCIIDCQNSGQGFIFQTGETPYSVLEGFKIRNGKSDRGAGIKCVDSSPTITNIIIENSTASVGGGGIYCVNSFPRITDVTIRNGAADYGGGICCVNSNPTITNITIEDSTASVGGGGIYCVNSSPIMTNPTIRNNTANRGGGIYCPGSNPTITEGDISGNTAGDSGGGIYGSPTITKSTISGNMAHDNGGGIHGSPKITNSTISGNTADGSGGGIFGSPAVIITNSTISGNIADCNGGGIYSGDFSDIRNCKILGNWAKGEATACEGNGGGILCKKDSDVNIENTVIAKNIAKSFGGGIRCEYSDTITITNCNITGNAAKVQNDSGGGIHYWRGSTPGSIALKNTIIWGNDSLEIYHGGDSPNPQAVNVTYCYVNGSECKNVTLGAGNINGVNPPGFIGTDDYHLSPSSPCKDKGTDVGAPGRDIEYRPRTGKYQGDRHDIGAYEYQDGNTTMYVSVNGSDANDGSMYGPFKTIQMGIDMARDGDTVMVNGGTYTGYGNVNLDFKGKVITVKSESGNPEDCIIDCQNAEGTRGFYFHNSEGNDSKLEGFTILNGNVSGNGGGIYCYKASPTINNMIIKDNKASGHGGGIACYDNASPTITNTLIAGNTASAGGGIDCVGNCSPTIINTTITGSKPENSWSGGIYCRSNCHPTLTNTIIWNDTKMQIHIEGYQGPVNITLECCDVKGGEAGILKGSGATVDWKDTNINADPLFENGVNGDYRLSDSSPCIGAGTGSGAPATDIEGNPRPDPTGSDPDIGAYENSRSEPDTIYISVWPGDTNNNGIVDQADVLPLGTFWHGTGPARVPQSMAWQAHTAQPWVPENAAYADANGSGKVDQADVLPIGSNWHKTHQTPSSEPSGAIAAASGDMSIVCDSPQPAGTDFWVDIQVGSEGTPVENLFGISFVFQYSNTNVIDVMEAQLEYDFLGPESELVYISPMKDDSAGTVSIGVTRKSGNSGVSGYGKIARLKMKFVNSASCGNSSTMTLTDIVANDPDGNIIDLGSEPVTVQVDCGQYAFQRKLDSGWNMVSFSVSKCFYQGTAPTQPPCVEMVDVKDLGFNSLAEWFSSVVSPGDAWQMVIGAEAMDASLDPVFHSLKYMSPCEGYWVKVKQDVDNASLNLDGGLFDPACAIPLSEGWNLVGCHLTEGCYDTATEPDVEWVNDWLKVDAPVAKQVLNSIDGKYSMVIDSEGAYNPALPPAFNSIHYMACGFAYWVKMDRAGNLVYSPDSGGSSVYAAPGLVSGIPVVPSRLSMVAYGSVTCDGRELSEGSRMGFFA